MLFLTYPDCCAYCCCILLTLNSRHLLNTLLLSHSLPQGVLFLTYSTLIGNLRGKSRLQQVIDWLGGPSFDGCLLFDECHKAKNFVPGKEGQSTKVS